ncbi:protein-disulfide reductase DsbD domain-containing protein [Salinisphaera aquimarina]|uniref:Protein-disulfide reductase DsbD domain-containing protein n=1 Tax=Salinisphaera aquimarina TaxID=2094031 RepID=A0ABV7EWV3_9GAMM
MADRKDLITHWLIPLLGAIAVGGYFLYWQWPSQSNVFDPGASDSVPASADALSSTEIADLYSQESTTTDAVVGDQLPSRSKRLSSASFVQLHASREAGHVRVELIIDDQWHINANPASYDFLIPTEVHITADGTQLPITMDYPVGDQISVGLDEPIHVYSGRTDLVASLPERSSDGPLEIKAQVQACNDSGLCLPPSMLSTEVLP